jgi:hypothetical protein
LQLVKVKERARSEVAAKRAALRFFIIDVLSTAPSVEHPSTSEQRDDRKFI